MKKTYEDRKRLIDRLERKYAVKMRLRNQERPYEIKNALRKMRGKYFDFEDLQPEPREEFFHRDPKIA